ncbi:MAG TPA: sugar phosphate isomerase/epimerase [Chthoniobacteraceae bacterium]|nr:sugar phosphate isomerase/epimerase [Chthoniobacteraceae bacterium]
MQIKQVAIQLYTLRNFCKTAEDYANTLKRVRAIGYEAIQISAVGPIPPSELRSIAEGEGLTICATHEPAAKILDETDAVIERLQTLGCTQVAYPNPGGIDLGDAEQVEAWFPRLDRATKVLREAGITLSYHNHSSEFAHYKGKAILEWVFERTEIQGELDTYWVQHGGGSSVHWCERLAGRLPLLHIKDYGITLERVPFYTEIGNGNLNFPAIIAAAEKSGCQWFIVEQDTCPGDPFDSITQSFNYIRDHLVS